MPYFSGRKETISKASIRHMYISSEHSQTNTHYPVSSCRDIFIPRAHFCINIPAINDILGADCLKAPKSCPRNHPSRVFGATYINMYICLNNILCLFIKNWDIFGAHFGDFFLVFVSVCRSRTHKCVVIFIGGRHLPMDRRRDGRLRRSWTEPSRAGPGHETIRIRGFPLNYNLGFQFVRD